MEWPDAWDAEIREILPPSKLITPDNVRGSYETLENAVLSHAWPSLEEARGRFMFVLDESRWLGFHRAAFHRRDRSQPCGNCSRQRV